MKKALTLFVLVLVGAAFVVGYWPEHLKRVAAEDLLRAQESETAEAQSRVRAGELLGQLLSLRDAALAKNYGQAQELSTRFFDAVRNEGARTTVPALAKALEATLGLRDAITAGLVQADPGVLGVIRQAETNLRDALGYARAPGGSAPGNPSPPAPGPALSPGPALPPATAPPPPSAPSQTAPSSGSAGEDLPNVSER
ncbi:MAG TPA: hypothetical protein VLI67_11850 [Vicinamibacteria bacterium]|nr:hypothetical protein [Vicinamibacteria bacterium]